MKEHFKKASIGVTALLLAGISFTACTGENPGDEDTKRKSSAPAPPVVASYVVDGGTESRQDVRVAIHGVRRIAGASVLDWSVTPLAGDGAKNGSEIEQRLDINVVPSPENSQAINLIDPEAHKVYRALDNRDDSIGCLCVPWFMVESDLKVGETRLMQSAFPQLPADLEHISVSVRNIPLAAGVPITDEGEVPTGAGMELDKPARKLPIASESESFVYPVDHVLDDPMQKMNLVVNEVIAGDSSTSLVFTVTAEEAGEGLNSYGAKPVSDRSIVPYGTIVSPLVASGPGIRASDNETDAVVRAWFATYSAKTAKPPGVSEDFAWRECLCSNVQLYGERLAESGRSVTLVVQMPPIADDTGSVEVIFPDESLPTIKDVKVTQAKKPAESDAKRVDVGTWTYGTVAENTLPSGWSLDEWPTPVPDSASIAASEAIIDKLEVIVTDDVSVQNEDGKDVEVTLDSTVSFLPDSAKLTDKAKDRLKQVAADISASATDGSTVSIEGHVAGTDQGSKAFQEKLSTNRAQAVAAAIKPLVDVAVKYSVVGKGATEPVAPNDTEAHRKLNRRVVVTYGR